MKSLNIGVIAYGLDPSTIFVRVPNERGRWMMVDRCVAEVDCPWCRAIAGEPCRSNVRQPNHWSMRGRDEVIDPATVKYHVATHVKRREAWAEASGHRFPNKAAGRHKLRINADDLAETRSTIEDPADA